MRKNLNVIAAYSIMMGLIILVGIFQSWNIALSIFNLCLISPVMTMGANIQWGYAGLINFGIMGYTALGGLAAVLISVNPVQEAWSAGGSNILFSLFLIIGMVLAVRYFLKKYKKFFMYVLPESMEPESLVQLLSTDYKFAVSFSILVIVLLYRPSGIFKGKVL